MCVINNLNSYTVSEMYVIFVNHQASHLVHLKINEFSVKKKKELLFMHNIQLYILFSFD